MRPQKKPKYKMDPKKFEAMHEYTDKKEKDWIPSELYEEMLKEKSRRYRR